MLIVEDHELLAQTLALTLESEGVPAQAVIPGSAAEVLGVADHTGARLVLLDIDLGIEGITGLDLVEPLRGQGATVLMLTGERDELLIARALDAGAIGVVDKSRPFDELVEIIHRCLAGEPLPQWSARPELSGRLARHREETDRAMAPFALLTPREAMVLQALVDGLGAKAIAGALYVSLSTVRSQIGSILSKLNVNSQLAAVAAARQAGWSGPRLPRGE